jgi:uncharacterized protein YndB with AHSA1/START domain
MSLSATTHNTFVIERSYPAAPDRVFAAFADQSLKRRWFVESDHHQVEHYTLHFQVGGKECTRVRFNPGTPVEGLACTNDTTFLDIVPNRRVVFASSMFLEEKCISAALATVELTPSESGTKMVFTHQAAFFEGADGPEMRAEGWRKLLENLTSALPVPCA